MLVTLTIQGSFTTIYESFHQNDKFTVKIVPFLKISEGMTSNFKEYEFKPATSARIVAWKL